MAQNSNWHRLSITNTMYTKYTIHCTTTVLRNSLFSSLCMINQIYNISGWVPTYEIAGETKSHWIYWYASLPYLETLCCLLFQSPFKIHWKHCSNKVVLSFPLSLTTWFFDRWSRRFLTYGKSNFNRWINIQNLVPHSKSNE